MEFDCFPSTQPQRIHHPRRIGHIAIQIRAAVEPNRVLTNIPPLLRVVVAVAVVVEAALFVLPLALEPDGLGGVTALVLTID